jgi:hypothetical protein
VQRLVWYEEYVDITDAIQREASLRRWPRQWKIEERPIELFRGIDWCAFCTVVALNRHGMDSRVCARRFAPCSALE